MSITRGICEGLECSTPILWRPYRGARGALRRLNLVPGMRLMDWWVLSLKEICIEGNLYSSISLLLCNRSWGCWSLWSSWQKLTVPKLWDIGAGDKQTMNVGFQGRAKNEADLPILYFLSTHSFFFFSCLNWFWSDLCGNFCC
jgi:hypothetical protein